MEDNFERRLHNRVQSLVRHVLVLCTARVCRTRVTACGCVSAGVGCGVLFLREGRCAESPHTGLSQRAFPERLRHLPRPHTLDLPLPHPLCAASQDPEPLALFLLDHNITEASDRLCQSRSLGLPCGLLFAQSVNLITSGQMSTHGARDTRRCRRGRARDTRRCQRGLCAQPLVSLRLDSHLESRDHATGVCMRNSCPRDTSRLISLHLEETITSPFTLLGWGNKLTIHLGRTMGRVSCRLSRFREENPQRNTNWNSQHERRKIQPEGKLS